MSGGKSARSLKAICSAVACGTAGVAAAQSGDAAVEANYASRIETAAAGALMQASDSTAPAASVRISIGPHTLEPGVARYAVRAAVAGSGMSVSFSSSPPASGALGDRTGFGGLPRGLPVSLARLTSGFGARSHPLTGTAQRHSGIDLAAPHGAPVVATAGGTVGVAGWAGGYGLLVSVDRPDGLQTRYGHLSRVAVTAGQQVGEGDVIGYVGSTGRSTGPHVHYEVRVNGVAVDPLPR